MKKCPACGSEFIRINGVNQRKKGALYYLTGTAISDMGTRHGYKMAHAIKDKNGPNAECLNCHHKWVEK